MIHPDTEIKFINDQIGFGVVATKLIKKGTITWALDKLDREFTIEQVSNMEPIYLEILNKYTFRNNKGNFILCWDHGRFVNHSFNSNCMTTAYDFEIAVRDILPGEQLTDDYGYLNVQEPFEAISEGTKRKVVYPDDLLNFSDDWDMILNNNFKYIKEVPQKLRFLIPDDLWMKVIKISEGKEIMDSIKNCYFEDTKNLMKDPVYS